MADNNLPVQNITGNDELDIKRLITEAISELQPNDKSQEFKLNLSGADVTFKTQEELQAAINSKLDEQRQLIETLLQTQAQLQTQVPEKTEEKPETFSKDKFAELLEKDVLQGFSYAMQHTDLFRNVQSSLYQTQASSQSLEQRTAAQQFRESYSGAREWLDADPANVQRFVQTMKEMGAPATIHGMEAAYGRMVVQGLIPPPQNAKTQNGYSGQTQNNKPFAPPSMGRNNTASTVDEATIENFWNLSEDQRRGILNRMALSQG